MRQFKVGFAEQDISPAIGMEQPGGYGKAYHRAFHDPCKVRTAVFDDGRMRAALVGVDALMIPRRLVTEARQQIVERCGILPQAVLIGAHKVHDDWDWFPWRLLVVSVMVGWALIGTGILLAIVDAVSRVRHRPADV